MRTPRRAAIPCLLAGLLVACTTSSGVVPIGQGTYMVSRSTKGFRGASGPVKAAALREANHYCEKSGTVMRVVRTTQKDMKPFRSDAAAEVYFECLDPSDPKLGERLQIEEIRE